MVIFLKVKHVSRYGLGGAKGSSAITKCTGVSCVVSIKTHIHINPR